MSSDKFILRFRLEELAKIGVRSVAAKMLLLLLLLVLVSMSMSDRLLTECLLHGQMDWHLSLLLVLRLLQRLLESRLA